MTAPRFVRELARRTLRRYGLALVRYAPDEYSHLLRQQLLEQARVNLVLDVGANLGQYVDHLGGEGYPGRIVSFEPTASTFDQLRIRSKDDPAWHVRRLALGEERGTAQLHR